MHSLLNKDLRMASGASNYCTFLGCENNSRTKGIHMYRFPKDSIRCKAWVDACNNPKLFGISSLKLNSCSRVCHNHFQDWCFMNINLKNRLVHNAIPNAPKPLPNVQQDMRSTATHDDESTEDCKPCPNVQQVGHLPDTHGDKSGKDCKPCPNVQQDGHLPDTHGDKSSKDCKFHLNVQHGRLQPNICDDKSSKDCQSSSPITNGADSLFKKLLLVHVLPRTAPTNVKTIESTPVCTAISIDAVTSTSQKRSILRIESEPKSQETKKPKIIYKVIGGSFFNNNNSNKQIIRFHQPPAPKVKTLTYHCYLCTEKFNTFRNLMFHMRKKHSLSLPRLPKSQNLYCCALCKASFSKENMSDHLQRIHNIQFVMEELEFKDFGKFLFWKLDVEKKTKSKYRYFYRRKKRDELYRYYVCHRSSQYARRNKVIDNNKIPAYCPAFINVCIRNSEYKVTYCSTHIGHSIQIPDLPLAQEHKSQIADIATGLNESSDSSNNMLNEDAITEYSKNENHVISADERKSSLEWIKTIQMDKPNEANIVTHTDGTENSNDSPIISAEDTESSLELKKTELMKIFQDAFNSISNDKEAEVVKNIVRSIQPILKAMRS